MKKPQRITCALVAALGSHLTPLLAQNTPVVVEAETGTSVAATSTNAAVGDWAKRTTTAPVVTYMTSLTDVAAYTSPTSPGGGVGGAAPATAARVLTYTVTFPGPGSYDLYARMRVGAGAANDDSYFYSNGFGTQSPTTGTDWITANGLSGVGYGSGSGSLAVDGGGGAASGVWKWVNMSKYNSYGVAGISFTVAAGALTQTFQIGAREDGLDFDKFVFGQTGLYFSVSQLDAGTQGSATAPVTFVPTGPALATGKSKYLGCEYDANEATNFDKYWNAVTPGNAGKWGSVEGTRGTFNWTDLDKAYAQAVAVNGVFRMHNLIWGAQQPTWMKGLPDTTQLREIKKWYAAVATHFQGKRIDHIDVVNEPINTPPTGITVIPGPNTPAGTAIPDGGAYINALGGTGATGYDWIITAFQLARQYFPNSKLMINEYSVENSATRAATYATIINLLKARGLLDGVGIQGHAFSTGGTPAATINANLATLAATGVPLYITEYDSDALDANGNISDAVQLAEYQRVFPLFWENPNVKGVTLWGAHVGHWRTAQGDYLINADNTERPALTWLRSYVQNTTLGTKAAAAASAGVFLYPNPASGSVALSLPTSLGQQPVEIALLNTLGQTVLHQTLPASAEPVRSLPLPGLAKGLYTMRLSTGAGTFSQRLTID